MKRDILLLGNEKLYEVSSEVCREELPELNAVIADLHDTLVAFREKYNCGRAIAAPQIGVQKRILYMYIEKPVVFLNPILQYPDDEMMEVMDDCMSFPGLLVKVLRHKRCVIQYRDLEWKEQEMELSGDLSELLQHEYDHLDGLTATRRAIDDKAFFFKAPEGGYWAL